MFLNYSGVQVNQSDVASIVKGSSDTVESATEGEIKSALARHLGRFRNNVTGEPWNLDFIAIPEPAPTVLHRYLCEQRPVLGVLGEKKHVVIIYRANFEARSRELVLRTLTYYDPATDRDVDLDSQDVASGVKSLWLFTASKPASRVF